jgi:hypothetical protein
MHLTMTAYRKSHLDSPDESFSNKPEKQVFLKLMEKPAPGLPSKFLEGLPRSKSKEKLSLPWRLKETGVRAALSTRSQPMPQPPLDST